MFRKTLTFAVSTLMGALFTPSALAQCNALCQSMAGPTIERYARQAYGPVDYALNNFGGYGYYPGGYGYPMGGGRVGRDIGAGMIGAAVGGAIGGRNGAIIGGVAGVGAAELGGYYANRRNKPLDCGKKKLSRDEREECAAIAQQAEAEERAIRSTRTLNNRSGQRAFVTDGGQPVCLNPGQPGQKCFMDPGEVWPVDRPVSGRYAVTLEVPKGPGIVNRMGEARSLGSRGWEIIAPQEVN